MASIDDDWLATFQSVVSRAAHEVKGALNGVAVNLEVARSRSERDDAAAPTIRPYAAAAAAQLAVVIELNEALLGLSRAARQPVDVALTCRHLASLLGPAARTRGGELALAFAGDAPTTVNAPANAVRAAIGRVLLDACAGAGRVECRCESADTGVEVTVSPADEGSLSGFSWLSEAGIEAKMAGHGISMVFH